MTLRMVSGSEYPRPVIDVTIGIKSYEAFINMSIEKTRISVEVYNHINECKALMNEPRFPNHVPVEFPIRRRNRQATLKLDVHEQQTDPVILGMDFFMRIGFTLIADRVSINERSPVMRCPRTIDFLYNQPQGIDLQSWLEENNRPMYCQYQKGEPPELAEEQRVSIDNDAISNDPPLENEEADMLQLHPTDDDLNIE